MTDKPEILFARQNLKDVLERADAMFAARQSAGAGVSAPGTDASAAGANAPTPGANAPTPGADASTPDADVSSPGADAAADGGLDFPAKEEISYQDFDRLQFQVGKVLSCQAVPNSKKLLCSRVQIGSQVRQIVSGIRREYTPEEMVGKTVMVLVNIKPVTLAGMLSEGMLLCAQDADGKLSLVVPEKEMPSGAQIS